jgi:beta-N-acetylhexosaminidase
MVTHILYTKITGRHVPTSLSRFWVDGLLRGQLHYQGPVVTDALDAAALKGFTPAHVALAALRAGDDELLEIAQTPTDNPPADLLAAYPAVLGAVRSGKISTARLDQSVARILDLKWKLGLVAHPYVNVKNIPRVVGTPRHLAVAQTIAQHSITLLKNAAGVLPLQAASAKKVLVVGFGQVTTATIGQDISARGLAPTVMPTGSNPSSSAISAAVSAAAGSDLVIVTTFNAWGSPSQVSLVKALLGTGKPVVVAAVGTPYDIAYFPQAPTFITSYGYQPVSLHALVKVLFGQLAPRGKLPVTINLYPFGYGLSGA